MSDETRARRALLALAVCVGGVATCGIVYQLIVGTISTYLLGNSTLQYSVTIGLFMSAYGLGSFASTRIDERLLDWFALTEVLLGLVGGTTSIILFWLYATTDLFEVGRVVLIAVIGTLVGLEIPLLVRISEEHRNNLRITVGQMMGFDYIGALVGGVAFPLLLLPVFGLLTSSFLIGICNLAIAAVSIGVFWTRLSRPRLLVASCVAIAILLGFATVREKQFERWVEGRLYEDTIVHLEQTPYQRIAVTKSGEDLRLFLDGSLQFSSMDEYRYHEALVHPAASRLPKIRHVLILGGGDGLAARELRHYPEVESVTLVDLDPAVVELGKENPELRKLNADSLRWEKLTVVHDDAFSFVQETDRRWDLVIVDLPDPHHESLAKLYSVAFYRSIGARLSETGIVAAQLGSPFFARNTFWTAVHSMERAGLGPLPYHAQVPSFGEWGFALGGPGAHLPASRDFSGRFYQTSQDEQLRHFPPDMQAPAMLAPNTLIRPVIVEHFRDEWRRWN